jgi:hypothetical protein
MKFTGITCHCAYKNTTLMSTLHMHESEQTLKRMVPKDGNTKPKVVYETECESRPPSISPSCCHMTSRSYKHSPIINEISRIPRKRLVCEAAVECPYLCRHSLVGPLAQYLGGGVCTRPKEVVVKQCRLRRICNHSVSIVN